ncbi:MAG: hypothetical protein ABI832_14870 [bacterium]
MIEGLEARLAELATLSQTTTYGQLARDLHLTGPATIARLTDALEALMADDAAASRPLRAAVVNARGSALPAPGFFAKAQSLGYAITDPAGFVTAQRQSLSTYISAQIPHAGPGV